MGNLLGDYGEYMALAHYNLRKAPTGASGFDAYVADGKKVEIKANHSSSTIGLRGEADLLLVLEVESNGEWKNATMGPSSRSKKRRPTRNEITST